MRERFRSIRSAHGLSILLLSGCGIVSAVMASSEPCRGPCAITPNDQRATSNLIIAKISGFHGVTPEADTSHTRNNQRQLNKFKTKTKTKTNRANNNTTNNRITNLNTNHVSQSTSRHRYEIVITQQGNSRIIFDQNGKRHVFHPQSDGGYAPATDNAGTLIRSADGYQWINHQGWQHRFFGSYLTEIHRPGAQGTHSQTLSLRYRNGQLSSVSDAAGQPIQFKHRASIAQQGDLLEKAADGNAIATTNKHCPQPDDTQTTCDTDAHPLPGFNQASQHPPRTQVNVTRLDARPASCASYFIDYFGAERGSRIESAISQQPRYSSMETTVRSFPIVDFIDGQDLIVLRSRDLANPSFNDANNPNALLRRLRRDGREIQTRLIDPLYANGVIEHTENGETTTLLQQPDQQIVLQLLIRHQIASPDHWRQIEIAQAELLSNQGIRLEVIIIP